MIYCVNCKNPVTRSDVDTRKCPHCGKDPAHEQKTALDRNLSHELRDAMNLIGKYCSEQLPDGWMISLEVTSEEMNCELSDPNGDAHDGWDSGERNAIVDCCDYALHTAFDS